MDVKVLSSPVLISSYRQPTVGERAKLYHASRTQSLVALLATTVSAACLTPSNPPTPSYEVSSRHLVRLDADVNGDGRIEQRTYLDGTIPFRTELDADGDGRIDRWEYVDARAQVVRVGSSSRRDGIEDQWIYAAEQNGERRVERSSERTPRVDRREFYRGDTLARVEEDTNQDGSPDKWELYDGGVLREVAYDAARERGRPDRRLVYDAQGRFLRLETDEDGDGRFEVTSAAASNQTTARE